MKRDIGINYFLVFFTFGIYSIFWLANLARDINVIKKENKISKFIMLFHRIMSYSLLAFIIISNCILVYLIFNATGDSEELMWNIAGIYIMVQVLSLLLFIVNIFMMVIIAIKIQHLYDNYKLTGRRPTIFKTLLFCILWLYSLPYLQGYVNEISDKIENNLLKL